MPSILLALILTKPARRQVFIGEQRGGETAEEPFYEALERGSAIFFLDFF